MGGCLKEYGIELKNFIKEKVRQNLFSGCIGKINLYLLWLVFKDFKNSSRTYTGELSLYINLHKNLYFSYMQNKSILTNKLSEPNRHFKSLLYKDSKGAIVFLDASQKKIKP